jgi:hypothetical protein
MVLRAITVALRAKSPIRPSVGRASKIGYGYLDKSVTLTNPGYVYTPSIDREAMLNPKPVAKGNGARYHECREDSNGPRW